MIVQPIVSGGGGSTVETVTGSFRSTAIVASLLIGYSDGQSGHSVYKQNRESFELTILKNSIMAVRANSFSYTGGLEKIDVSGMLTPDFDTYFVSDDFSVNNFS